MKSSIDDLPRNFKDLDTRFSDFKFIMEDRLQRIEGIFGGIEFRITNLEEIYHHLKVASPEIPSDIKKEMQMQI